MRDVAYVPDGHERQKLDLCLPAQTNGPSPLILWIHGGAWTAGSQDDCPAIRFMRPGSAVASVSTLLLCDPGVHCG